MGYPYEALAAWRRGEVVLLISKAVVDEIVEVLRRPFFRDQRHVSETDVVRVKRAPEMDAVLVSPKKRLRVVGDDPDDDRVLECAFEGGADYLVSGDHHLLELGEYRGTRIVGPREFLAAVKARQGEVTSVRTQSSRRRRRLAALRSPKPQGPQELVAQGRREKVSV